MIPFIQQMAAARAARAAQDRTTEASPSRIPSTSPLGKTIAFLQRPELRESPFTLPWLLARRSGLGERLGKWAITPEGGEPSPPAPPAPETGGPKTEETPVSLNRGIEGEMGGPRTSEITTPPAPGGLFKAVLDGKTIYTNLPGEYSKKGATVSEIEGGNVSIPNLTAHRQILQDEEFAREARASQQELARATLARQIEETKNPLLKEQRAREEAMRVADLIATSRPSPAAAAAMEQEVQDQLQQAAAKAKFDSGGQLPDAEIQKRVRELEPVIRAEILQRNKEMIREILTAQLTQRPYLSEGGRVVGQEQE